MKEITGDIWNFWEKGASIVITTNGYVKRDGSCVMGRGIAFSAKQKFPKLPLELGEALTINGNHVFRFPQYHLFSFPVKHVWWEPADLELIEQSCQELLKNIALGPSMSEIYLVRPGCGNGQLQWKDVKPILEKYFTNDAYIVVEKS